MIFIRFFIAHCFTTAAYWGFIYGNNLLTYSFNIAYAFELFP